MGWKGLAGVLGMVLMSVPRAASKVPGWMCWVLLAFMAVVAYLYCKSWAGSRADRLERGKGEGPALGLRPPKTSKPPPGGGKPSSSSS